MDIIDPYFGYDRIKCFISLEDLIDKKTGKSYITDNFIRNKLKIHTNSTTTLHSKRDGSKQTISREIGSSMRGVMEGLPVQICIKNDTLHLDFNLSTLVDGHNAFPTRLCELEDRLNILSGHLGFSCWNKFYIESVELAVQFQSSTPIVSITNSLGRNNKINSRQHQDYGIRYTNLSESSSIQVYSVNEKNEEYCSKGIVDRSKRLQKIKEQGLDTIRVELRKNFSKTYPSYTIQSLRNPDFRLILFSIFKKEWDKITPIYFDLFASLQNLDITSVLLDCNTRDDFKKTILAFGYAVLQNPLVDIITRKKIKNKYRLVDDLSMCEQTLQAMLDTYSFTEHCKTQINGLLDTYIEQLLFELC